MAVLQYLTLTGGMLHHFHAQQRFVLFAGGSVLKAGGPEAALAGLDLEDILAFIVAGPGTGDGFDLSVGVERRTHG
ncbi:hypothetical protein SDC9_174400 [bioreactor metagenome]|uniref:Uncharacterized protein n=1 Tax=bioreactor metagenome TaxID=1076179 RepID=A0A645GTL4_9ZZZZ